MKHCSPDVIVAIAEELSKDVYSHNTKTTVGLDIENSEDGFVEDGIPNILG